MISGGIVGVFGLPCSGKSTIIKALTESSKEILAHIITGDIARRLSSEKEMSHMAKGNLFPHEQTMRDEILKLVNQRRAQGTEIIFIDGCPRFDEQVKWMVDNQLAGTDLDGCLIQVVGDNLLERADKRMRDDQDELDKFKRKIDQQSKMIDAMEKVIFQFGIPYFTVINTGPNGLVSATRSLAKYIGLRK